MKIITTRFVVLVLGLSFIVAALSFGVYVESPADAKGSILAGVFSACRWVAAIVAAVVAARYGQAAAKSGKRNEDSLNGTMDARFSALEDSLKTHVDKAIDKP